MQLIVLKRRDSCATTVLKTSDNKLKVSTLIWNQERQTWHLTDAYVDGINFGLDSKVVLI